MTVKLQQRTYIKVLLSGQTDHMKFFLLGLTMECPLEQRPEHCPFLQYKESSFPEMVENIFSLTEEDVERLLLYHEHCYGKSMS